MLHINRVDILHMQLLSGTWQKMKLIYSTVRSRNIIRGSTRAWRNKNLESHYRVPIANATVNGR
jgi:hypothetical protein